MMTAEAIELAAATADLFGDEALTAARLAREGASKVDALDRTSLWAEVCAVLEVSKAIETARAICA